MIHRMMLEAAQGEADQAQNVEQDNSDDEF